MYKGLSGRGPNQYTGSRGSAQARANKIGAGGAALGLLSMGLTELEYANSLKVDYGPNMRRHLDNRRVWDQSARSEERRVGKECRYKWSKYDQKNKNNRYVY